ncbi:MAG: ADP-ribosylglycohydrolase family protein [Bacteroidota bacterium]
MDLINLQNLLIGFAIGDAFGAGVEFQDRDWIRSNVDFTKFVDARNTIKVPEAQKVNFTRNYRAWDYTDDTEMTIGLMKALIADEIFSEDLLIRKWKEEYDKEVINYCKAKINLNQDYKIYLETVDQLPDYELLNEYQLEQLCGGQPIQKPYFLSGIKVFLLTLCTQRERFYTC